MGLEHHRNGSQTVVGVVRWFSEEKGFGLIETPDGGRFVVDHPDIAAPESGDEAGGFRVLSSGSRVEFELSRDPAGKLLAVKVRETGAEAAKEGFDLESDG